MMKNLVSAIVVNWQPTIVQMINAVLAVLVVQDMVVMFHHATAVRVIQTYRAQMMTMSITVAIVIIT
tara:strand:- start:396 stop:596 length:201 start_codon:yes stop_codon:yes gene_type:complete